MGVAALAVEGHLGDPQGLGHRAAAVVGQALPGVLVHHQAAILDSGVQRFPVGVVQGLEPGAVLGHQWQQHAAAQARLGDPLHVPDGLVDIVGQDQADTGAAVRVLGAEIHQPAVVGANTRQGALIVLRARRLGGDDALGKKRRYGVGVDHLPHHPLAVLVSAADLQVPVAQFLAAVVLLGGVAIAAAPLVEGLPPLGVQVLAVLGVAAAGVGVGGDQDVGFGAHGGSPAMSMARRQHSNGAPGWHSGGRGIRPQLKCLHRRDGGWPPSGRMNSALQDSGLLVWAE